MEEENQLITSFMPSFPGHEESLNHYRAVFDSLDQGFCIIEVLFDEKNNPYNYRFVDTNPAFERHTGIHNATGKTIKEFVPDLEEYWFELYGNVALTGKPAKFENAAKQLDRYYTVQACRFGKPGDKLVAVIFNNITEQRKAEQQVLTNEKVYRTTLDNLLEGCAIIGFNWDYIYVNDANARHAHCKKEEMIGKNMLKLLPGVEKSVFFASYKRCMEERTNQHVEDHFVFEDGTKQWFESFVHPVPEGIFILVLDITERKTTELKLQKTLNELTETSLKLQQARKIAKIGFLEWDLIQGKILWSNELYDIFERDRSLGPPTVDEAIGSIHPDDRKIIKTMLEKAAENGLQLEFRVLLPGGKIKYMVYYVKPVFDENGKQIRRVGSMQDITERKLAALQLQETLTKLQEKVAEREVLLRELYHRTKNNMQVISSLLNIRGSKITDETHRNSFLEMRNRIQAMSLVHERLYRTGNLSKLDLGQYLKDLVELLIKSHIDCQKSIYVSYEITSYEVPINVAIPCGLIITELVLNVIKYAFPNTDKGNLQISLSKTGSGL
ncbi:MAG: PAS domain S-box protein [Ignavibacteriaceae bacterium]